MPRAAHLDSARGEHFVADDIGLSDWVEQGLAEMHELLAKHAAFHNYLREQGLL